MRAVTSDVYCVPVPHAADDPGSQQMYKPGHNLGVLPLDHVQQL